MSTNGDLEHEDAPLMGTNQLSEKPQDRTETCKARRFLIYHIVLFVHSLVLFVVSIVIFASSRDVTRNAALKAIQIYSPVLEDVDIRITDTLLNGSLWVGENPDAWRGFPDTENDKAWNVFDEVKPIVLTGDQIRKIGKDPETAAKFEDAYWGLGDDAYIGALDLFHQIHCLKQLRAEAFRGWDGPFEYKEHGTLFWVHLRHCTDMLMQHMLCTADTGILTFNWMEDARQPFPDMSVHRKCRDWTQLIDYQNNNGVDTEKYYKYLKPDGANELKQPPEYWAWLEEKYGTPATPQQSQQD